MFSGVFGVVGVAVVVAGLVDVVRRGAVGVAVRLQFHADRVRLAASGVEGDLRPRHLPSKINTTLIFFFLDLIPIGQWTGVSQCEKVRRWRGRLCPVRGGGN